MSTDLTSSPQGSIPQKPVPAWRDKNWFRTALLGSVAVGALIRFLYIFTFVGRPIPVISGDGLSYHLEAIRLAEGLGYTSALWRVGTETAHHPPGWLTLLGGFSALGLDDIHSHQMIGAVIGLLVIVMAALIGRRLFGEIAGAMAGAIAAIYPGFWVLEAQILSEPLALVMLGASTIALYRFGERTDMRRALQVGVLLGLTALVRSEQLALLVIVVPVILWRAQTVPLAHRALFGLVIAGSVLLLLSPWAFFNATRFQEPVLMSTNFGATLLAGNCRSTFDGDKLGFYDFSCLRYAEKPARTADWSVRNRMYMEAAIARIKRNLNKLPLVVAARFGRTFGIFRPEQTVKEVAIWHGTPTWPVWAWLISFWVVFLLAIIGLVTAIRARSALLPLLAPIFIMLGTVAVFFGEPRYHTMADLSLVVLAGLGAVTLLVRSRIIKEQIP